MTSEYLLHFAHEHIPFRWIEFSSLASKHFCKFQLLKDRNDFDESPYIVVQTDDKEAIKKVAKDSFLIKNLFQLWGSSSSSIQNLSKQVIQSPRYSELIKLYGSQTFRVDVEAFGKKIPQNDKVNYIREMLFLEDFNSHPDLKNPQQHFSIFIQENKSKKLTDDNFYFGRRIQSGNRRMIHMLDLRRRCFIANTSMDPQLSLIASNAAKVKNNDLVLDPFVGSGGLLIAAAKLGAYTIGGDIDWALLHGKSRPSRSSDQTRKIGESIKANFDQYLIKERYLDVIVSDISRCPWIDRFRVDAIISDPPYGIREGSEKIGYKKNNKKQMRDGLELRFPSKTNYELKDLLSDLLCLASQILNLSGRLVYFFPVPRNACSDKEEFIAKHPSLKLISYSEQSLTVKTSRLMIVMEKVREPQPDDLVTLANVVDGSKFRELYFSGSKST